LRTQPAEEGFDWALRSLGFNGAPHAWRFCLKKCNLAKTV
jgi:hypothetical protein